MSIKVYDNAEIKKELQKKMREFKAFCAEYDMPMFVTAAIKNDEEGTTYLSDMLDPVLIESELTDDHIHEHLKILKGFVVVSKNEPIELEFDTVPVEEKPKKKAAPKRKQA